MTDQELSALLKEWKPTPAPGTLQDRVFPPQPPRPWWDYIPATPVAAFGALAGVLIVWSLAILAPREQPKLPVAAPQPVEQPFVQPPVEAPRPIVAPKRVVQPPPSTRSKATPPKETQTKSQPAAPAAAANTEPVTVQPRLISRVDPAFPLDVPPALMTSIIKLRLRIGKDGHVLDAVVIEGEPALRDIAVEAVKQWLYTPKLVNGNPTETAYEMDVSFQPRIARPKAVSR